MTEISARLAVFQAMQRRAVNGIVSKFTAEMMAGETGISVDRVRTALLAMRENGAILVTTDGDTRGQPRIYRILDASMADVRKEPTNRVGAVPQSRKDQLRALWAEGHSTAEIGRRLFVTKNAIVGMAHRMDLPSRPSPIRRDPDARPSTRPLLRAGPHTLPALPSINLTPPQVTRSIAPTERESRAIRAPRVTLEAVRVPPPFNFQSAAINRRDAPTPRPESVERPIVLLKNRRCQFPLWGDQERPTHVYCDEPCERSWCETHHPIVLVRKPRASADDSLRHWQPHQTRTPLTKTDTSVFVLDAAE